MKLKSGKIVRRGKCRLIFQGGKQGATWQGWAKIRAEAEKGNLHRGEKEARKQQDSVGKEGLPSRYEKVDVTGQAWGRSGREESTNKRKKQALSLFLPSPGLVEN
jgi:hypothetical protein